MPRRRQIAEAEGGEGDRGVVVALHRHDASASGRSSKDLRIAESLGGAGPVQAGPRLRLREAPLLRCLLEAPAQSEVEVHPLGETVVADVDDAHPGPFDIS